MVAPRSRDPGNTATQKRFVGGELVMTGANSAAALRSTPARYVFLDEVDAFPLDVEGEGDPVALAVKRSTTFRGKRKILEVSTPTLRDFSRIEAAYNESDRRRYFVPCPNCGGMQTLEWARIAWPDGAPNKAHAVCEHCAEAIEESHKPLMLAAGEAFLKTQLRAIAAGVGVTYEQLTGDLSGVNYSSIRTGLLEHRRRVGAVRRQTLEPRALDPLWRRWVTLEILSGRLDAPDFEMAPDDYFDVEWLWPSWGAIDATKEIDAEVSAIAAGLKSRRSVIAARGDDPDAVLEAIASEPPPPAPPVKPPQPEQAQ